MVQEFRQDVIANNIANAETPGFKRDLATFAERARSSAAAAAPGGWSQALTSGVWLGRSHTDFSVGMLQRTDRPTDVALTGPGFFEVATPQGRFLTRDGRLVVAPDGAVLAASDGAAVLSRGGAPLRVNPRGGEIRVTEEGRVMQNNVSVGELSVVDLPSYDGLQKVEAGRFRAPAGVTPTPVESGVQQGHVEESAVEPVVELVTLLETTRAHQFNAQMLTLQDQTVGRLISAVSA